MICAFVSPTLVTSSFTVVAVGPLRPVSVSCVTYTVLPGDGGAGLGVAVAPSAGSARFSTVFLSVEPANADVVKNKGAKESGIFCRRHVEFDGDPVLTARADDPTCLVNDQPEESS